MEALDGVTTDPVFGFLVPSNVRGKTQIIVKTSPRRRRSTLSPVVDIDAEITVMAHRDDCGTADLLAAMAAPVVNELERWGDDIDATSAALSTEFYRVDGFDFSGGDSPGYDDGNRMWYMTLTTRFSGVILKTEAPEINTDED